MASPKLLLLDVERTTNKVAVWDLKVNGWINPEKILEEWYIPCGAWKWLGKGRVESVDMISAPGTKACPDKGVVKRLAAEIAKADGVIAHNGARADMPWIKARMVEAGLSPPPPVPVLDTLRMSKSVFGFNAHNLAYLGKRLGVGDKIHTTFNLWLDVMAGDRKALAEMVRYNKQDIRLLEAVYLKLRAWAPAKVNAALGKERICPACGEAALHSRGFERTRTNFWRRYQCTACGAWSKKPMKGNQVR